MSETEGSMRADRARNRDRGVLRGVVATIVVNGITSGGSLLTIVIMARALSTAELGLVLTLVSIWMLVLLTTDLGICPVLSSRIAAAHGREDIVDMRAQIEVALAVLSGIATVVVVAGSVAAFTLPWASWIGGGTLSRSTVMPAVMMALVMAGLTLPSAIGSAVLTGLQRQARAQTRLAVCSIAGIIGCVVAGWAGAQPWAFVLAFLGPQVVTGIVYTWLVLWIEYPHLRPRRMRPTSVEVRGYVGASASMAAVRISDVIINGTGVVVVAVLHGPALAAVYGVASRISLLLASVLQTAGSMVWPAMTEAIARGDHGWARSRYRRSITVVLAASLVGGLVVCLMGPLVSQLLASVRPPVTLFVALTVVMVVSSLNVQMSIVVTASQRYRPIGIAFLRGAPVGIVLSVILTSTIGVVGPALAAAVAYGFIVSPQIFQLARRTLRGLESSG